MVERIPVPVATRAPHGTTNTFIIGTPGVLVDPAGRTDPLDSGVNDRDIAHIAVTHTHPDHVGAVEHYANQTDATVWCRYGRRTQFENAAGVTPDRTFFDGTAIGTTGVTTVETPGHAPEHTAFAHDGQALVGDLLTAHGSVFVGAPEGDMRAYFASLRRVLARSYDSLHPAHGDSVTEPTARILAVIAHRKDREQRIENAIQRGSSTVDQILDAAYDKDLAGLEDLAARTVRAHLEKLAVEGKLSWDGETALPPAAPTASRNE